VAITHKEVQTKIHFFQNKDKDFISLVLHEIKPTYLGAQEQLYGTGDDAKEIYFILEG